MANPDGTPVWYELVTSDPDDAANFYGAVMGWKTGSFGGGEAAGADDYRIFNAADGAAAGLMKMPDGAPMRPGWVAYFGVADVDAKVTQVTTLGGSVHMPANDLPGVGRMAMVGDPQGAPFYLMRGDSPEDSGAFGPKAVGHCSWNELHTTDQKAALGFYGSLLGWTTSGAMPMGAMGDYTFVTGTDGVPLGAMMDKTTKGPADWVFYFRLEDIDAAKEAIESNGGIVREGPHEVPGGGHIIVASDPQGAAVGFVAGGI